MNTLGNAKYYMSKDDFIELHRVPPGTVKSSKWYGSGLLYLIEINLQPVKL